DEFWVSSYVSDVYFRDACWYKLRLKHGPVDFKKLFAACGLLLPKFC
ncbi:hypothetical protein CCACVL1_21293, partial [Corchorus capsularis]